MSSKAEKTYLINLQGGGDTYITLVSEDVWNWILLPFDSTKSSYYEEVPAAVKAEMVKHKGKEEKVMVTRGSWENDRALAAPGKTFDSVREMNSYLKTHDLELEDEFHGYAY